MSFIELHSIRLTVRDGPLAEAAQGYDRKMVNKVRFRAVLTDHAHQLFVRPIPTRAPIYHRMRWGDGACRVIRTRPRQWATLPTDFTDAKVAASRPGGKVSSRG